MQLTEYLCSQADALHTVVKPPQTCNKHGYDTQILIMNSTCRAKGKGCKTFYPQLMMTLPPVNISEVLHRCLVVVQLLDLDG